MATDAICPWILGIVMLLVLLGTGRGLLWGLGLDRMRCASNVLVALTLGMMLFHYVLFGLTRFGPLEAPWPWLLLGLGGLLALPGLYRVGRDLRGGPLGWRGAGSPPALLMVGLLLLTLVLSAVWLTGAFGFTGLDTLLAEGRRHAAGVGGGGLVEPQDRHLRDGLWEGWAYGLGAPGAALVLFWGLLLGMLVGAGALGRNLHSRGAGLAAALLLALLLFAGHGPLRFEAQVFGALALLAVVLLAVEGRRRPQVGWTLLAGLFAGYAWVADPLAWALLLPLALFAPSWCKTLDRGERVALDEGLDPGLRDWDASVSLRAEYRYEREEVHRETATGREDVTDVRLDVSYDYDDGGGYAGYGEGAWLGEGPKKKYGTPLRHGALGLGAGLLGASPALSGDVAGLPRTGSPLIKLGHDLDWPEVEFGAPLLDTGPFASWGVDPFWSFFVLGGLLAILALGSLAVARHRRKSLLYLAPGVAWLLLAGTATGYEEPVLAGYPLLAGLGGLTLAEAWLCRELGCLPSGVGLGVPGAIAVGGLGLTGAYDCGYWNELDAWHEEREEAFDETWRLDLRYDWRREREPGLDLRYDWRREREPGLDLRYDWRGEREPGLDLHYDWGREGELRRDPRYDLDLGETREDPARLPGGAPGGKEAESEEGTEIPRLRPGMPGYRPHVQPDPGRQPDPGQQRPPQQQQSPPYTYPRR